VTEDRLVDIRSAREARERLRELIAFHSENGFIFVEDSWRDIGSSTVYLVDTEIRAIHVFPWAPGRSSLEMPDNVMPWELLNLSFEVIADPEVFVDKTHLLQTEAIAATALNNEFFAADRTPDSRDHIVAVVDLSSKAGLLDLKMLSAESLVLPRHRIEAVVEKLCGDKSDR